jgi:hypothetical protein
MKKLFQCLTRKAMYWSTSMEEVMRVILPILILCLFLSTAHGQTSKAFEKDYGKPTDGYSASAHISMTPEYSSDGQVCRARLNRKQLSKGMKPVSKALPFEELKGVLNQLIPPRLRGAIKDPFRVTDLGGREGWTTYSYENVSIVFAFPVDIDPKDWKGAFTFPVENSPPKQESKPILSSNSDFSPNDGIEVVMVTWTHRPCPTQIDSQRR